MYNIFINMDLPDKISPSKESWLKAGLKILSASSHESLTIEILCESLKLTKGSFYHNFKGRGDYTRALLEYWSDIYTEKFIEKSNTGLTAKDRQEQLYALGAKTLFKHEKSIRAWAQVDTCVSKYQKKIDRMRYEYLFSLFFEQSKDKFRSEVRAKALMAIFIGSQQFQVTIPAEQMLEIYEPFLKQ